MSAHSNAMKRIKSASKRVNNKKRQNSVGDNQDMEELGIQTERLQPVPSNSQAPDYMVSQGGTHRIPTFSDRKELTLDQKGLSVCFLKNKKE